MSPELIAQLNEINRQFYATIAQDFSDTRQRAWQGWLDLMLYLPPSPVTPYRILDVGCGNGRFGIHLAESLTVPMVYHGTDNNETLLSHAQTSLANYDHVDVELTVNDAVMDFNATEQYDLVVLFGVIHHVPSQSHRQALLKRLADCVRDGGLLVFASWRFYEFERFQKRLVDWDAIPDIVQDQLETHDYLLDWRRGAQALRYCHYVDDTEQDELVQSIGWNEIARYRADGFTNTVNCYSILQNQSIK